VLTPAAMAAWGWRVAFLLGGALGGLGVLLRRSLEESPAFLRMRQRLHQDGEPARGPLAELFAQHRGRILLAIGATGAVVAFNGLLFAQVGTYLVRTLGYPPPAVSSALNVAVAVMTVSLVAMTLVADRVGRLRVYGLGCAVLAAGAVPAYAAMIDHTLPLPALFALIGLSACCTHGTFAAIMADLFPTRVRFSGVAFSMNISAVAFSGLGPVLVTWLAQQTGWRAAPGLLVLTAALVSLGCTFALPAWSGQIGREDEAGHAPAGGAAPGAAVLGAGSAVAAPTPKGG
jgi:MFS transporter, MHS family, proline/betaine transporter